MNGPVAQDRRHWWQTRWFVMVAALIAIVPLIWPTIPPLTDLPGHIGRYRVMLGTDADVLSQWYRFQWRLVGNLGADLAVAGLAPLVGLEPAVKLVVIATVALTVTGLLWISSEIHGRVSPFALFALPLAYSYAFQFGFIGYCLSLALALNAFALWLRLGRQRWRIRAALFVPVAVVIWAAHVVGWGLLGLMAFGAEIARHHANGRSWPAAAVRGAFACLPLALPLALILAWQAGGAGSPVEHFLDFELKGWWLALMLRDRWMAFDAGSIALLVLMIPLLIYAAVRERRVALAPELTIAAVLLLGTFVLMPFYIFGSAYADMRIAPVFLMIALLAFRPDRMSARSVGIVALAGLLFFGARTAGTTASYALYSAEWDRDLVALDHVPRGARLLSLVGEACTLPWALSRTAHLSGMAIARRAAFSNDQWRIRGTALLLVTAERSGEFATDPSQTVLGAPCAREPRLITLDQSLATFPRDRFDYVWLIRPPAHDPRGTAGLIPVWRNASSILYRVENRRLPPRRGNA